MSEDKNKTRSTTPAKCVRVVRGARSDSRGRPLSRDTEYTARRMRKHTDGRSDDTPQQAQALQPANSDGKRGVNDHERKSKHDHLRLTAEEAAQREILKDIIGKKSGSEADKYFVKDNPRCLYPLQAGSERNTETEHESIGSRAKQCGVSVGIDGWREAGREKRVGGKNDC
ncbi:hypothetical protein [Bacteroides xylanisolvens]|uniref:hypothetical protein n=1 Tax=Bacteroides xylanisolvens TaxID=371601 RepID=UPI001CE48882|nr:hypothetical protein [Bacteroides xylanisolvens]